MFARRITVKRWQAAGSPPINDAGRLYAQQLKARLDFEAGRGAPADDPREPSRYPLGHTRFVALDIDATPERVRRLEAAGLVRPFSWESWHWAEPDVYIYPIVDSIPASAYLTSSTTPNAEPISTPPEEEEDDMRPITILRVNSNGVFVEGCRIHPGIGTDLKQFVDEFISRTSGSVTTFRGGMVSADWGVVAGWRATDIKGADYGRSTIEFTAADYISAQREASRLSVELAGQIPAVVVPPK
jgi:hypothetical protein